MHKLKEISNFILFAAFMLLILFAMASGQWNYIKAPQQSLSSNYVKSLAIYKDVMLVASDQGLSFFSLTKDSSGTIDKKNLPRGIINDIKVVGDSLWIASSGGISVLNLKTNSMNLIPVDISGISNAVKCIFTTDNEIWFGTDGGGAYIFSSQTNEWTRLSKNSGLSSDNIRSILIVGDTVFFGTNTMGLSLFSRRNETWSQLDRYDGLSNNNISTMVSDRTHVYVCTYHGLSILDKGTDNIKTRHKDNGLFDDMVLTVARDGRFLWLGGMGGITLYDIFQDKMTSYSSAAGVPEDFITCFAVYGNLLYMATDGKGIAVFDKGFPSSQIDKVEFKGRSGTIFGNAFTLNGKTDCNLLFYNSLAPSLKFNKGIKLFNTKNGILASWDITGVIDGNYIIELNAKIDKGQENTHSFDVNTDTFDPEIMIEEIPAYTNKKQLPIQGSFREKNPASILLYPGPVKAAIDFEKRQFSGSVELMPGRNTIRAKIFDQSGQNMEVKRNVLFSNKEISLITPDIPLVTKERTLPIQGKIESDIPLKEMSVYPGSQTVSFDNSLKSFQTILTLSNDGENLFILKVTDVCGNIASKKVVINLDNGGPDIILSPVREFTSDSITTLEGSVSDPMLKEISVIPGELTLAADTTLKHFTFKPRLKNGKNTFVITAADKLANITQKSVTIIRDMKKPELTQPVIPPLVKDMFFTINGKYDEDNIESITIDPGGTDAVINEIENSYSARIKLNNNENPFTITAKDKAGNINKIQLTIYAKIDDADKAVKILMERISGLERTIDSLKKAAKTPSTK